MVPETLQFFDNYTERLEGAMVAACVSELGPLSADSLRAMWWPMSSLAAVRKRLDGFRRQGYIVSTLGRFSPTGGARVVYYHPSFPGFGAPNTLASLGRHDSVNLLAALRRGAGGWAVSSTSLASSGSGRMVLFRRCAEAMNPTVRFTWLDPAQMTGAATQALLLIPDHQSMSFEHHRVAAQAFAAACLPSAWNYGFPPPTVALVAATPERHRSLRQFWSQRWTATPILSTTRARLDHHGWLSGIWQFGADSARLGGLFDHHWPVPARPHPWEAQECW